MVKTKPIDVVSKKWVEKASGATDDYRYGISNPKVDWQEATEKAFNRWQAGIQQAIANKTFIGGVRKAGTAKWQERAKEVGATRYSEGVRTAEDDYREAMSEVLRVIEGVTLPEKGPKGDPRNYERVKAIGDALFKWKLARKKA